MDLKVSVCARGLCIQNSREDSSGSVVTGETGLAHTGTIVDNEGSDFVLPDCQRCGGF